MWSLTSRRVRRTSGPQNFQSSAKKAFFNTIGHLQTCPAQDGMSASRLIVLQKSKVAGLKIFRENTKQRAIADSYDINRVTEVACEFCVRPRGPSHLVQESRAHGPQNFGRRRKKTLAT